MTVMENRIADADMQTILSAWNDATDRLRQTHETLRDEVRRLTDELEIKNRELARKNRLADLGQMASHVAHEVRNSLVPMKLYLSLLNRRLSDDAGSQDIFEKISAGFVALEATVSDLLNFSAERDPQRRPVDVELLLNEVFETFAPQLDAQSIVTHIDVDPEALIIADPDMLRRAIVNLVLNALDVMPGGGELVMTACQTRRGLEIEVADSGPGIISGALPRLFEPFFTTKGAGTGLGLAIVERIAAAHGGIVYAANCPEGGAAFTLCLPSTNTAALLKANV
ncbi:MAG: HAMP domain-containing histidine kinase [Pirellulaceae bacterium]|nr:HAMP domain-containing histidine kinase [Pirellulaceae bacterium]